MYFCSQIHVSLLNLCVELVLNKESCKTRDLGGNATTREMTRAILEELNQLYA